MKLHNPASLLEILKEYLSDDDINESKENIELLQKIQDGAVIDDEMLELLANKFHTSKEFWSNIHKQHSGE